MTGQPIDLVVLDMDGTMVDTLPGIAHSVGLAMTAVGLEAPSQEFVRRNIGGGARNLVRQVLGPDRADQTDDILRAFADHYDANAEWGTSLYPNVAETLAYLKTRVKLGVATAKSRAGVERVLDHLGLQDSFDQVVSMTEMVRPKPDPYCVELILGRLGVAPERALLVGDTMTDIGTARNAGLRAIAVTYGYGREAIAAEEGLTTIDDFGQLRQIVV
ncbi:MAG: HAD-IA family hydrolase [Propionibacteriaceae bacterium]|jgi:phosphoglycolate phosphatase|nr:HAD-IA family hydrolase [Propionibacteriaceae bacterium]